MTHPEADFGSLGVPRPLVDALAKQHLTTPFEIQTETIPPALAGKDVLGRAPTGSGKTIAFGIPLIAQLDADGRGPAKKRRPSGLVLSPTRELAEQIRRALHPLAAAVDRSVLAVYGGVGIGPQAKSLARGVDILVACPGRLQDLIDRGDVSLDQVSYVVVDEADRMADMGFLPAVTSLLDLTNAKRQTVLFSATLDNDVKVLIKNYQHDPVRCEVGEIEPDLSTVTHRFIATRKDKKLALAADLIDDAGPTMVFCRTRHGVDRVARQLKRLGVKAGWIHGGRTQAQRDAALHAFTTGRVSALVATDVAARGIHVDGVGCVIHYDPPADAKDYVHRSGRTARAGAGGAVVSLVNDDQFQAIARLQKQTGLPITDPESMPGLRAREAVPWVDERTPRRRSNGASKSGSKSRTKARSKSKDRPDRDDSRKGERRAERARSGNAGNVADDRRGKSQPRSKSAADRRTDGANGRSDRPERTGRSERPERSGGPRRTAAKGSKRSSRPGSPSKSAGASNGTHPKAAASANGRSDRSTGATSQPKQRKKRTSKRSGRARAKNHKQSRAAR